MKRAALLITCLALVVASCGDDEDSSPSDSVVATEAPAATDAPAATEAPTTTEAPATTEAPTATEAPAATEVPAAAAPAPIVPEVVCTGGSVGSDDVYFRYTNEAAEAVAVDEADSFLTGANEFDEPYVPFLFAPGEVSLAFYAVSDDFTQPVTWTVVGPDGTTRTAAVDETTPECTAELLGTSDTRTPTLEVSSVTPTDDGSSVTIVVDLLGVPETSVCANGLEAEPVSITMDDGNGGNIVEGTTSTWTSEVFPTPDGTGERARFLIGVLAVDQCSGAGVTQSSWPIGEDFEAMIQGVCVTVEGDEVDVSTNSTCSDIPATGGGRVRPSSSGL